MEKTKDLLQFKMESGLRSGEWDETNPEDLKDRAYDSHSEAYLEAGLADLPQEDIDKIITAVDREDMLELDALKESGEVGSGMIRHQEYGKALDSLLTGTRHVVPSREDVKRAARRLLRVMSSSHPRRSK